MRRAISTLAISALALAGTTACEPPPPPASFTVNVAPGVTGDDADPGDGVCETAPGNGQCTLDAAVQEGNALGRADIHVPPAPAQGAYQVLTETTITGQLSLVSEWETVVEDFEISAPELHIAAEGRLSLEQLDLLVTGTITVEGALLSNRSHPIGWTDVRPGGIFVMLNSVGGVWASALPTPATNAWVTNRGTVLVRFSRLYRNVGTGDTAFVHTLDEGTTSFGATNTQSSGLTSPGCLGTPPISHGYNHGLNCGVAGPGDTERPWGYPLRDIPVGTLGCGTEVTMTIEGVRRPEPDGPALCSRGPHAWGS